jgi:hypothetical protein
MADLTAIRQAEEDYCKANVDYYVAEYVKIEIKDAAEIIQPFRLWPAQAEALQSIVDNRLNIILKARQLGVTWLVLAVASHSLLFKPGFLTIALSRTEDEAKELVRRLEVIFKHMPEFIKEDSKDLAGWDGPRYRKTSLILEIIRPGGISSTFKAFPSGSGAGRSFTADLLILDEWAFQESAEAIWLSTYPTINRPTGGKVIGLSTIDRGTLFERLYTEENNFNKLFLPWWADPRRDQAWYDQTKIDIGDLIIQEYPATVEEALTIPGGSYFPEFKQALHIIPGQPDEVNNRYVAIDYGLDMFAVLFVEVDPKGKPIIYKEIHESDLIVFQAARRLLEAQGSDKITAYYAPPDLWARNRDTGRSTAEIFADHGIPLSVSSAGREQGCLNVKEYLRIYKAKNEQTGEEKETALLQIYEGAAPNLVRCLTKVQKDEKKLNEYANTPHNLTHIIDALRCFCTARPAATKIPPPPVEYSFSVFKPKPDPLGKGGKINVI